MIRKSLKSPFSSAWALCAAPWRAPRHRDGRHSPPRPPNIKARSGLESTIANPMYARAGGLGFPEIFSTMRQKSSAILKMCTSSLKSEQKTIESANIHQRHVTRPQRRHGESATSLALSARPEFRCARREANDSETTSIDNAQRLLRPLLDSRCAVPHAPPPETPPKTTMLLWSITMPAPCLPVGNVWPVRRKLLAPGSFLPFAPAPSTGTVQEAASRSTTGISMFILARGHESPAARLASLAEERSVHPLAWRQVLTTGKADRTRVSRAIGVGPPSGTGVTGSRLMMLRQGAACKPSFKQSSALQDDKRP